MLTAEENELFTRVGPDTPLGKPADGIVLANLSRQIKKVLPPPP